jgi:adenosylcobinamide kinase/adenosylcobinamide-phosphate guanylyltransferase
MAELRLPLARSELILGGQKSGKSRRAEMLARDWLAQSTSHHAVLIATAHAGDEEMQARIARHQQDRMQRVPSLRTVEAPFELAQAILQMSRTDTLIVVDCLTLWLTHMLMPQAPAHPASLSDLRAQTGQLLLAISEAPGPIVLVGNEIGLGVIPMGKAVREFVDALGLLNQQVAAQCQRVTLMAAGLALTLKASE